MNTDKGPLSAKREAAPMYSFCQHVVVTNKLHSIENVHDGGLVCATEATNAFGIIAYLGTPLRTPNNERIGSLCVIENRPRDWSEEDKRRLEEMGEVVVKEIALRYHANEHLRAERDIAAHIVALKELNSALDQKNRELQHANRIKSEFLATMSHEIRTPMNGVIGFTSLLLETKLDTQQKDYTETIRLSGEALLDIINDVLDFSAIESGKVQLNHVPFSVHQCLSDALDVISIKAHNKGVETGYTLGQDVPEVLKGDLRRIRQVLVNVLGNAVKFTNEGSIEIEAFVDKELHTSKGSVALHIVVRDTGIGISKDKLDNIFEAFSQVDSSDSRRYGGTGLGLSICKALCTLMGGKIWAESEEGAGSSFHIALDLEVVSRHDESVRIPGQIKNKRLLVAGVSTVTKRQLDSLAIPCGIELDYAHSPMELSARMQAGSRWYDALIMDLLASSDSTDELLKIAKHYSSFLPIIVLQRLGIQQSFAAPFLTSILNQPIKRSVFYGVLEQTLQIKQHNPVNGSTGYDDHAETNGVQRLRALIAEDNLINQKLIIQFTKKLGLNGDIVSNGREVIEALSEAAYDLILMDVNMPEQDGIETTRLIRSEGSAQQDIYIIGITATVKADVQVRGLDAGMNDFLCKPITIEALKEALDKMPAMQKK